MKKPDLSLYAVIDLDYLASQDRDPVKASAAVLKGGATVLQLRSKTACDRDFYACSADIMKLCKKHRSLFVVNDRVDIAAALGAPGLHIGWSDMPLEKARSLVKRGTVIGFSASTVKEAVSASRMRVDYIGVGPVFPTSIKETKPLGAEALSRLAKRIRTPIVAIGGINRYNIPVLQASGIRNFAMITALLSARDIEAETRAVKKILKGL